MGRRFFSSRNKGIAAAAIGFAVAASPFAAAHGADPAIADKIALCQACHGPAGISTMENVPSLAAQPDAFLQYQLVFFRSGARKSEIMEPIASALSDSDIRQLSQYYAGLKPPPAAAETAPELSAAGSRNAAERHCAGCHTDRYAGTQATARLAAQREDYLAKALLDFKTGKRIGGGVAAMPEVAFSLTAEEIKALAHFLARLP